MVVGGGAIAEDCDEGGVELAGLAVGVDDGMDRLKDSLGGAGGGVFLKKLMSGKEESITVSFSW